MASRTYGSASVVMSICTMTAPANVSNSLTESQREESTTRKSWFEVGPAVHEANLCRPVLSGGGQNSQLLHQPESIPISPAFDKFPISYASDGHSGHRKLTPRFWYAGQVFLVSASSDPANRDSISIGNHVFNGVVKVRKCIEVVANKFLVALDPAGDSGDWASW